MDVLGFASALGLDSALPSVLLVILVVDLAIGLYLYRISRESYGACMVLTSLIIINISATECLILINSY